MTIKTRWVSVHFHNLAVLDLSLFSGRPWPSLLGAPFPVLCPFDLTPLYLLGRPSHRFCPALFSSHLAACSCDCACSYPTPPPFLFHLFPDLFLLLSVINSLTPEPELARQTPFPPRRYNLQIHPRRRGRRIMDQSKTST